MKKFFQASGDASKDKRVLTLFEKEILALQKQNGHVDQDKIIDLLNRSLSYAEYYVKPETIDIPTAFHCSRTALRLMCDDTVSSWIPDAEIKNKAYRHVLKGLLSVSDFLGDGGLEFAHQVSEKLNVVKKERKALKQQQQTQDHEGARVEKGGTSPPALPVSPPVDTEGVILGDPTSTTDNAQVVVTSTDDETLAQANTSGKKRGGKKDTVKTASSVSAYVSTKSKEKDLRILELLEKEFTAHKTTHEFNGTSIEEMAKTHGMQEKVTSFVDRGVAYSQFHATEGHDLTTALSISHTTIRFLEDNLKFLVKSLTQEKYKYRVYSNYVTIATVVLTEDPQESDNIGSTLQHAKEREKESRKAYKQEKRKLALLKKSASSGNYNPDDEFNIAEDDPNDAMIVVSNVMSPSHRDASNLGDLAAMLVDDKLPTLDAVAAYGAESEATTGLVALMEKREVMDKEYMSTRIKDIHETIKAGRLNVLRVWLDELGSNIARESVEGWLRTAVLHNQTQILRFFIESYHPDINGQGPDGDTLMHISIKNCNVTVCRELLGMGANVDAVDSKGRTPLMLACLARSESIAQLLLEKSPDLQITDKKGNRALQYALSVQLGTLITSLLDLGALSYSYRPDLYTDGERFLEACKQSHTDVAQMMAQYGSMSLEEIDEQGRTPLHYTAQNNLPVIASHIIQKLSFVDPIDFDGMTPLHLAASQSEHVAKLLLNVGSDLHAEDSHGNTPLHYACFYGVEAVARLLLDCGAAPNARNHGGNTPLHYAVLRGEEDGMQSVVTYLLKLGADVNAPDDKGDTALMFACQQKNTTLASSLLRWKDISINTRNLAGYTPLLCALSNSMTEVALLMIQMGADVNSCDVHNSSPLSYACAAGLEAVCFALMQKGGVDLMCTNDMGNTSLHYAANSNMLAVVRLLLESGVDVNVLDHGKCTPLHYSALNERSEVTQVLIEQGASIHALNVNGNTPLDHAMKQLGV